MNAAGRSSKCSELERIEKDHEIAVILKISPLSEVWQEREIIMYLDNILTQG